MALCATSDGAITRSIDIYKREIFCNGIFCFMCINKVFDSQIMLFPEAIIFPNIVSFVNTLLLHSELSIVTTVVIVLFLHGKII